MGLCSLVVGVLHEGSGSWNVEVAMNRSESFFSLHRWKKDINRNPCINQMRNGAKICCEAPRRDDRHFHQG